MSASAGTNATITGSPAISFYNDGKYIRAVNGNTNVTNYFNKSTLTFQADAATAFFLKNDTLQTHYLYADVVRPTSANLAALMETFQRWIEDAEIDSEASALISDQSTTVLEVKTAYDKDPMRMAELLVGGGTATYDTGRNDVQLAITTGADSRTVRQTKAYASTINNKFMYAVVSGVLITDTAAKNVITRMGCFDNSTDITVSGAMASGNGVFMQYTSGVGGGLSIVMRTNISGTQVDTSVAQASWSEDAMDGTGRSGLTLSPTAENTLVFEWSALRGSVIRVGILNMGRPVWCHTFTDVRFGSPSVPIRWSIMRKDAADLVADVASMRQGAASVLVMGSAESPYLQRAFTNDRIRAVTAANSPMPIISMRLRGDANRAKALPRKLRIMNLDQGVAKWRLVLNPTTLTGANFVNVGDGSYVQTSEEATATSGGIVMASGFFSDAGTQTFDLNEKTLALYADIAGNSDILTLQVVYLRGTVTVSASLEWAEQE